MPSQNTLIWVGAAASAVVAAGAGAFAWTHPGFPWRSAAAPVAASAPAEPKTQIVPSAVPAPPAASAAAPGGKAPNEAAASPQKPAFDVVNVDPSGEAVIAGRAAPNAKVELRDAGKTVAEATADAAGQFVIIPPALAPGDHSLSLAASAETSDDRRRFGSRAGGQGCRRRASEPQWARAVRPRDADAGDADSGRRLSRRDPIGRGRRRRRAHRQRFGRTQCNRASLSQSGRCRRGQDAIGRPLVADDQTRHDPGRLRHARR